MSQKVVLSGEKRAKYDVAIIGAGLAGSLLATLMAQQGWRVLLLEKARFPRHKVCGEFLSPEAQQVLLNAGLHTTITTLNPVHLTNAVLISRSGTSLDIPLPGEAWGISRYALDHALARAAQFYGTVLWEGCMAKRIEPSNTPDGTYRLSYRGAGPGSLGMDESTTSVRAVVLASGRNTAKQLHKFNVAQSHAISTRASNQSKQERLGEFPLSPHGFWHSSLLRQRRLKPTLLIKPQICVGIKAHFCNVQMPNRVELFLFDGGYVGINPLENGAVNVSLLASYSALNQANRTPAALFDQIKAENRSFAKRLAGAEMIDKTLCSVAPVNTHMRSRPWLDVACVGDVATMIPPLCGDGMAMALRSAELCAPLLDQFLRGDISQEAWRQQYTQQWHAEFDWRLRTGRLLQWLLNDQNLAEVVLRLGQWIPGLANTALKATRGALQESVPVGKPIK